MLTANILGEADNDTVVFGLHENAPPTNPSANEFSRLVGSINLGAGVDTLDYSGSDLVLVNAVTDNDSGSGQAGTVRDATTNNPPNLALISGTYLDVDAVVGNGTQLQGADVETVWVITGNGRGRYGNTFATATTTFENFSIRGGNKRDVFIFKQEGPSNTTPQLFAGIDGGDFVASNVTTHNFMLGSVGADQITVTGATSLNITLNGGSGNATTSAFNINNIGDAGLALTSGFNDTGSDTVTIQTGRAWAGNVLTNGGNDSVTLDNGARVVGTLNLGGGADVLDASAYTSAITARITAATAGGMTASSSSIAGDFAGVATLNLGSGNDVVTLTARRPALPPRINLGAGGSDELALAGRCDLGADQRRRRRTARRAGGGQRSTVVQRRRESHHQRQWRAERARRRGLGQRHRQCRQTQLCTGQHRRWRTRPARGRRHRQQCGPLALRASGQRHISACAAMSGSMARSVRRSPTALPPTTKSRPPARIRTTRAIPSCAATSAPAT